MPIPRLDGGFLFAFSRSLVLAATCAIAACSQAQDGTKVSEAIRLLQESDQVFEGKDYPLAADKARQAAVLAPRAVQVIQRAAEMLYLSGFSPESLPLFDRAIELAPESAPYNWQRGIALCSCGKFEAGAAQFKTHHDVNPDDVENSAWYFLCVAKTKNIDEARKTVIPSRGDGREPMMSVLGMLQGKLKPSEVLKAAEENTQAGESRKTAQFYAALYVGLYYDSIGDSEEAAKYLKQSLSYDVKGYMSDTARVYLKDRFEANSEAEPPSK